MGRSPTSKCRRGHSDNPVILHLPYNAYNFSIYNLGDEPNRYERPSDPPKDPKAEKVPNMWEPATTIHSGGLRGMDIPEGTHGTQYPLPAVLFYRPRLGRVSHPPQHCLLQQHLASRLGSTVYCRVPPRATVRRSATNSAVVPQVSPHYKHH